MTEAARNYCIIGIHGLRPKPPMTVLRRGWLAALQEGLWKNHHHTIYGYLCTPEFTELVRAFI